MGSALGNYIHLRYENYERYGTSRGGKSRSTLWQVYNIQLKRNQQRINSLKEISPTTLKALERRVRYNLKINKDQSQVDIEQAQSTQVATEIILKDLSEKIGSTVKLSGGGSPPSDANLQQAQKVYKNLIDRIRYLNKNFNEGNFADTQTLQTIVGHFNEYYRLLGYAVDVNGTGALKKSDIQGMDIVSALKIIDNDVAAFFATQEIKKGDFGEKVVAMCSNTAMKLGAKAVEEEVQSAILKKGVKGAHMSKFQLTGSMLKDSIATQIKKEYGKNLYQAHQSQDKVDVSILVGKEPLNVNVKNYASNLKGSVTVDLQDVNLLYQLAATAGDFGNHWLNLHCQHVMTHPFENLLNDELEEQIKYEALVSGNLLKQGTLKANTFVAMDSDKGRVIALSTKDILKGHTGSMAATLSLNPRVENIVFNNKWANTWESRIANIISQVHQTKIKVSLKTTLK